MKKEKKPLFVWDVSEIIESEFKFKMEMYEQDHTAHDKFPPPDEEELRQEISGDSDLFENEWDGLIDGITEWIKAHNPSSYWYITVENFGWRSLSGEKWLYADNGADFLRGILPQTDCTFRIYRYKDAGPYSRNSLEIRNAHHDAPTGNERYLVRPALKREINSGVFS